MAETFEQIVDRYQDLLLRELPEDVYADSGRVVQIGGEAVPFEIHKRSLRAKATALAYVDVNAGKLQSNVTPDFADEEIETWEWLFLKRTHPGDPIQVRRDRVKARARFRPNLSVPYLRWRLSEVLGYEPIVTTARAGEWKIGTSGLGVDTLLAGGWYTAYTIVVKLSTNEPSDVIAALDDLLNRIEPARSNHTIENNTPEIDVWRIGHSALGVDTNIA